MFFQKVLKGIPECSQQDADETFLKGIVCNWWRRVKRITNAEIVAKLDERNLQWHLSHYDTQDPLTGMLFYEDTPYISLTAGSVERDWLFRRNLVYDPYITALRFATRNYTTSGILFYAHVYTLGRQSIELLEFAEEVRELNIYKSFLRYHPEGEITAKIVLNGPQIEKWEEYDGPAAAAEIRRRQKPRPIASNTNPKYARPERYCNIRGLVTD
jgi:hypothetical protein